LEAFFETINAVNTGIKQLNFINIRIRLYQFWVNVSDVYVSWSKVAIGLIIHKNDKKSWITCFFDACFLYEHFHENNPKNRKMQDLNNWKS